MTTAATIVKDAAVMAGVLPSGQALDSERDDRYRRYLNMMLDSWSNEGIDLGIGTLASGDTLYADDADLLGVTVNLALWICRLSRKPIDPDLRQEAMNLKDRILGQHQGAIELDVPDPLLGTVSTNIETG